VSLGARTAIVCAALVSLGATGAPGCVSLGALSAGTAGDAGDTADAADAAPALDGALADAAGCGDTLIDPHNCGRCGHDCLGGTCTASRCDALALGAVPLAPLDDIVVAGSQLFVASVTANTSQAGGVWRLSTTGGLVERYSDMGLAHEVAVLGDTLYILVRDLAYDGAGQTGGLYACPTLGAAPCAPQLVAPADLAVGLFASGDAVYYAESGLTNQRVMRAVPPAAPAVFRASTADSLWADGTAIFGIATSSVLGHYTPPFSTKLRELGPSGDTTLAVYTSQSAVAGRLTGTTDAIFFTAYDSAAEGGVVRRSPRTNASLPCDYGGTKNARPYGIVGDVARVYWTNQGGGAAAPYTAGTVASCPVAGCCASPEILWAGGGQPAGLTADADALYFVTYATGVVFKLAKP
jgi:hypothetical protein